MSVVAALDCGTNSLRLLIAELDPATGRAKERYRDMRIVRLGQGVDRTGRLSTTAMARVFSALKDYAPLLEQHQGERVRYCAPSAARDADTGADYQAGVRARLGQDAEILTGQEEARLSFIGATRSLRSALPTPHLVLDIGGGSTEFILGEREVEAAESIDIGSVRLTERHLTSDPPSADDLAAARADIDAALDGLGLDLGAAGSVIAVAGTATTVAAAALRLGSYDRLAIHHSIIDIASTQSAVHQLLAMSVEQRKALGFMHPGRADVIGAGGLILERVLQRLQVRSILISEHDILDGIAWSMAVPVSSDPGTPTTTPEASRN